MALVVLWIGGIEPVSVALVRSLEWQYFPPEVLPSAEMIIVLGGGTASPDYPRGFVELGAAADRVLYAGWLYHQGAASKVLLTGGYIPWMGDLEGSPAENMSVILGLLGVPQEALLLETESMNTYENALFSKEILDREGVNRIILVTSAQHMPRSVAIFKKLNVEIFPAPVDYTVTEMDWERLWEPRLTTQIFNFLPTVGNLSATTNAIKEYLGMMVYKWKGWI
jgi:uncharacterized SAM-binding protein YcdF (DUF218 family)